MSGFFGTRADFIIDFIMLISTAIPVLLYITFRLVKKGEYEAHKQIQIVLFILLNILVISLELDIRFGGMRDVARESIYFQTTELMVVFIIHLIFSIVSLFLWCWLIVKSLKRYPRFFNFNHKKIGYILYLNISFMVLSGWLLYYMTFAS